MFDFDVRRYNEFLYTNFFTGIRTTSVPLRHRDLTQPKAASFATIHVVFERSIVAGSRPSNSHAPLDLFYYCFAASFEQIGSLFVS